MEMKEYEVLSKFCERLSKCEEAPYEYDVDDRLELIYSTPVDKLIVLWNFADDWTHSLEEQEGELKVVSDNGKGFVSKRNLWCIYDDTCYPSFLEMLMKKYEKLKAKMEGNI